MTALALSPADLAAEVLRLRSAAEADARYQEQLQARIADLTTKLGAVTHERDSLCERIGETVRVSRTEPALTIRCSYAGCSHPPLVRDVAPPEDAIPQWLRGMNWEYTANGESYLCPDHKKSDSTSVYCDIAKYG